MYDFKRIEAEILDFWNKNSIYQKAKDKNKGKKSFYYLDGPPYTSGRIHVGTAWGKALRDSLMRYKRMTGLDVWDRAGFDMHGLPTEKAVEKKLGLNGKEDIEKMGVLNFTQECEKLCVDNMNLMIKEFKEMGVWMDFDNPYMSIKNSYIEGVWWLIKRAHEKGRLYEGLRTMPWCAECGSACAKHELEYENVTDTSIFLRFKIVGTENEYLLIWTTTPWTLPFNLAVMVNPEVDYVKCKIEDEVYIIAKALANIMISNVIGKPFEIIEEFKGDKLEGLKYVHPFLNDIEYFKELETQTSKLHIVILSSEYVDTSAGTGLVHCAPGCGPEDYEVGHREGLPPYNTLTEHGIFDGTMGRFSGWAAKKDDKKFIQALDDAGVLVGTSEVEHEYPYCQRSHDPVVFRTTKQWFFKVEDLKENMKELNAQVKWVPDWAGSRQFDSWLNNIRDNSITKQRYWGTPLPVWRCDTCNEYVVIGSADELKAKGAKVPASLHKPWIDEVEFNCGCGGVMKKVPDVIDVWVDAGCSSWLCLDYPVRTDLFEKLFPADFILEGKDQIRGWFNILLVCSMVALEKHPYKAVYMHGFINDSKGRKMSKSLGNYILPSEVFDKFGVDAVRNYLISGTSPGVDINYNFDDASVKQRNLDVLWNLHNFLIDFAVQNDFDKATLVDEEKMSIEEKWILSKLHHTIKEVTNLFEEYRLDEIPSVIDELYLELSRTYVQFIREKSVFGSLDEKKAVFCVLSSVVLNTLKMLAPVCPMFAEKIYLDLKAKFDFTIESVHLCKWPEYDESKINNDLLADIEIVKKMMSDVLAEREKVGYGVRWPLSKVKLISNGFKVHKNESEYKELIKTQCNLKDVEFTAKSDLSDKLGLELDTTLTPELEIEGYARELMRLVQAERKNQKFVKKDRINLQVNFELDLSKWKNSIAEKVGASSVEFGSIRFGKTFEKNVKGKKIEFGFEKI